MISEWAKKPECWTAVRTGTYSPLSEDIPELKPASRRAAPTARRCNFRHRDKIIPDPISWYFLLRFQREPLGQLLPQRHAVASFTLPNDEYPPAQFH